MEGGRSMSDDSDGEMSGEEWRQWMADRLAARTGRRPTVPGRIGRPRQHKPEAIDATAKAESDAVHAEHERPRTRGECGTERPCPWVSCRHHLYLDVNPDTGKIKIHFPDREPWELEHSCSLDLADEGGLTLEAVAQTLNVTRERIRQLEDRGRRMLRFSRARMLVR
jgi:hypothetical protein